MNYEPRIIPMSDFDNGLARIVGVAVKLVRETLAHEFTHHIESLAGERGLERKDEEFMEDFWERHGR